MLLDNHSAAIAILPQPGPEVSHRELLFPAESRTVEPSVVSTAASGERTSIPQLTLRPDKKGNPQICLTPASKLSISVTMEPSVIARAPVSGINCMSALDPGDFAPAWSTRSVSKRCPPLQPSQRRSCREPRVSYRSSRCRRHAQQEQHPVPHTASKVLRDRVTWPGRLRDARR